MSNRNDWLIVDKKGLAQVYARRGPGAPFFTLISNAWGEEGVTKVYLDVNAVRGKPLVEVTIEDNSMRGFLDLEEARTLFTPSYKKGDVERRGRFNLGEKLFLSLCEDAEICSTGGALLFHKDGSVQRRPAQKRSCGTSIKATMQMTRDDMHLAFEELTRLRSPAGIVTVICFDTGGDYDSPDADSLVLCDEAAEWSFQAKLQSELSDDEGVLRPIERNVIVQAWVAQSDEAGWLYEMGIPVVEIGGIFDLNVMQKVPLTVDRDNVPTAFLRRLRVYTLNHLFKHIESEDAANEAWVNDAMSATSPAPLADALNHIMDLRRKAKS